MKTKTMRILGVVFLIAGIVGIVGGIFFWFFHYWAMENGYRPYYGDSLMIACTISMIIGVFIYPAVPFLIISKVRRNRDMWNNEAQTATEISEFKFCIYCGKKVPKHANLCSQCGRKLN